MKKSLVFLGVGLALLAATGCFGSPAWPKPGAPPDESPPNPAAEGPVLTVTTLSVRETPFGKVRDGAVPGSLVVSPDGTRYAYVVGQPRRGQRVVLDGQPQEEFYEVFKTTLRFSPDSKRFGYTVFVGTPPNVSITQVIDGQRGPLFSEMAPDRDGRTFSFSPDSKRVIYAAGRAKGQYIAVVDGVEGKLHNGVGSGPSGISWSPDGKRWALLVMTVRNPGGIDKGYAVIDDQESKVFDGISTSVGTNEADTLVVLDQFQPDVIFSSDGKHVAFTALDGDHEVLLVDGKEIVRQPCKVIVRQGRDGKNHAGLSGGISISQFSPNGERLAYVLKREDEGRFVVDGQAQKAFKSLPPVSQFSPNGKRFGYIGVNRPTLTVVIDGQEKYVGEAQPEDLGFSVGDLTFSPDSSRWAAKVFRNGQALVTLDGKDGPPFTNVLRPMFSPDGKRLCHIGLTQDQKSAIVLDGQASKPLEDFIPPGPFFSPDSRHICFGAKVDNAWRIMVDDLATRESYDGIVNAVPVRFLGPDKVRAVAIRGDELIRVDVALESFDLKTVIADLKAKDAATRKKAAAMLASLGSKGKAAIPALVEAIKDGDPTVAEAVANALTAIDPDNKALEGSALPKVTLEADPDTLTNYSGQPGKVLYFEVRGHLNGNVYGTGVYTDDSSLATAAVHAGVLKNGETGIVKVTILAGQKEYPASNKNGVRSNEYGPWTGSFKVEKARVAAKPMDKAAGDPELKKASVDGKYAKLLKKIKVPQDKEGYGEFNDYGSYSATSYAGFDNLPAGYWVYVYPHWYIWGEQKK